MNKNKKVKKIKKKGAQIEGVPMSHKMTASKKSFNTRRAKETSQLRYPWEK